jgi:hypothetical protein
VPVTRDRALVPFGGSGDARSDGVSLGDRFRRHADSLERAQRSPLCVGLMRGAADDIDAGGLVAELFDGVPAPPGSVPALRLLAALHHLVLDGRAPALAGFYPSVGGERAPDGVWPVALEALAEHDEWVHERLGHTVQTNEPGRAAVLFASLLWLVGRYGLPIRLLEIGASAGLNLLVDRFCYLVGGKTLGDPASPVRLIEPWTRCPDGDLLQAAARLRIAQREGCDLAPLDPRDHEARLAVLSYIWPDENARLERTRAALELAAAHPPRVATRSAEEWLPGALAASRAGQLTVVWQSVVRQYIDKDVWTATEVAFDQALRDSEGELPAVWLRMEPGDDHVAGFRLTLKSAPGAPELVLAHCGDHGPPVIWEHRISRPDV